jgi:hypothetical protein
MNKQHVHVHTPCDVNWDTLSPRGTNRFCSACKKVVHDLSSLSEAEARALMQDQPTGLCVRYLHDEYGIIQFRSAPLVAPSRLSRLRDAAALVAPLLVQACGGADFNDFPEVPLPDTSTSASTSAPCTVTAGDSSTVRANDAGAAADAAATTTAVSHELPAPCNGDSTLESTVTQ